MHLKYTYSVYEISTPIGMSATDVWHANEHIINEKIIKLLEGSLSIRRVKFLAVPHQ